MFSAFLALSTIWFVSDHSQAHANETTTGCLIKIGGQIFDASPCDLAVEDETGIMFGRRDETDQIGYWVHLIMNKNETYEAYWNKDFGATKAEANLGTVRREDRDMGECFSGNDILLCRNIPLGEPLYYIEDRPDEDLQDSALLAYIEGVEYRIMHSAWNYRSPVSLMDSADLDGDGKADILVAINSGGNCCADDTSVVSYRGDGFFTFLDETPIVGGFGGTELVFDQGRPIIRVHDAASGAKSTNRQRGERDYGFINGHIELIAERVEHSTVTAVASLGREEVATADEGRKTLVFDVDADDIKDEITCAYWERWGVLNCQAEISGAKHRLDFQCIHVAVSPVVFGPLRSHRLMCDNEVIDY